MQVSNPVTSTLNILRNRESGEVVRLREDRIYRVPSSVSSGCLAAEKPQQVYLNPDQALSAQPAPFSKKEEKDDLPKV